LERKKNYTPSHIYGKPTDKGEPTTPMSLFKMVLPGEEGDNSIINELGQIDNIIYCGEFNKEEVPFILHGN